MYRIYGRNDRIGCYVTTGSKNTMKNNKKQKRSGTRKNANNTTDQIIEQVYGRKNNLYPMPVYIMSPQRYSEVLTFTLVSGAVQSYSFRANSLFDPDRTGTGHQPLGFDQLSALYNRYCAYGLSWEINVPCSNDAVSIAVGMSNGTRTVASVNDFTSFIESPTVRQATIGTSGGPPAIFSGNKSLNEFIGVSKRTYLIDDRFQSQITTNPTESIDLVIAMYNESTVSVDVRLNINLHYKSVFFDPVVLTQS